MKENSVNILVYILLLCAFFKEGSCCEDGWHKFHGYCFRIYNRSMNYSAAEEFCEAEGSKLFTIPSEFSINYVAGLGNPQFFWTGLHYGDDGKLRWTDATSTVKHQDYFLPERINKASLGVTCVTYTGWNFHSLPCRYETKFICGHSHYGTQQSLEHCRQLLDERVTYIDAVKGNCLFLAPELTTKDKTEEVCAKYKGHFVGFDNMLKNGLIVFYYREQSEDIEHQYWTDLTWNGSDVISPTPLREDLMIFIGTGSCITVSFNLENIYKSTLYQTKCDSLASVMCSIAADVGVYSTTTEFQTEAAVDNLIDNSTPFGLFPTKMSTVATNEYSTTEYTTTEKLLPETTMEESDEYSTMDEMFYTNTTMDDADEYSTTNEMFYTSTTMDDVDEYSNMNEMFYTSTTMDDVDEYSTMNGIFYTSTTMDDADEYSTTTETFYTDKIMDEADEYSTANKMFFTDTTMNDVNEYSITTEMFYTDTTIDDKNEYSMTREKFRTETTKKEANVYSTTIGTFETKTTVDEENEYSTTIETFQTETTMDEENEYSNAVETFDTETSMDEENEYSTTIETFQTETTMDEENEYSTNSDVSQYDTKVFNCPIGSNWKENSITGDCYWDSSFETERFCWEDAEQYCQSIGGHLSSFHSLAEEEIGVGFQNGTLEQSYWIGLRFDVNDETYKWSDGSVVNYTNWAPDHPDDKDKLLLCVAMKVKDKRWVSSLCGVHNRFICRVPKQINPVNSGALTPLPLQPCNIIDKIGIGSRSYLFQGSCYFTISGNYTWYTAKKFCEKDEASLVSIHSFEETDFLLKLLYPSTEGSFSVWTGLHTDDITWRFSWTDSSPVDFTLFGDDLSDNYVTEKNCFRMDSDTGLWELEDCYSKMGFICKRRIGSSGFDTTIIPSTNKTVRGNCKEDWIPYDDRCYYIGGYKMEDRLNWTEASDMCLSQGGYLASIRDKKEQRFLAYQMQSFVVDVWIGIQESYWYGRDFWVDGWPLLFTNWSPNFPSMLKGKDCVKMVHDARTSGTWDKAMCWDKLGYVCYTKKDPNMPDSDRDRNTNSLEYHGFLNLGNMYFMMFKENPLTWHEAEFDCRTYGANLVSVSDEEIQTLVLYLASKQEKAFWIGLRYKESTQTLKWLDRWPVTLTNWGEQEPSFLKKDVCFSSDTEGYWKKTNCSEKMPYICHITIEKPAKQKIYTGNCPQTSEKWIPGNSSYCYIFPNDTLGDWWTARQQCMSYGATLGSIHSLEELNFLKTLLQPGVKSLFIGLKKHFHGMFYWSDRTPVNFVNWDEGEPRDADGHLCVKMMTDTMKWRVTSCNSTMYYFCQSTKANLTFEEEDSEMQFDGSLFSDEEDIEIQIQVTRSIRLPTSTLMAIISGITVLVLLIVAVVIFIYKKSTLKRTSEFSYRTQIFAFENALYNADTENIEFNDIQ